MENATQLLAIDTQYLQTTEMIHKYAESVGLARADVYNTEKRNWTWKKGSASIEIFILRIDLGNGYVRDFIKIFTLVMQVPQTNLLEFYRRLLELNDEKLGIKLTLQKDGNNVWGTFERDINGMDYNELVAFISDFEIWADQFDNMLEAEFPTVLQVNP
ncbi:MAG: YbjN domain-containing protein [Ferruginibacter sp.]